MHACDLLIVYGCRWMYLQEYSEQNCDGDIVFVSGVPVGVCLPEYDAQNKAVGAVLFSCDSGKVQTAL